MGELSLSAAKKKIQCTSIDLCVLYLHSPSSTITHTMLSLCTLVKCFFSIACLISVFVQQAVQDIRPMTVADIRDI